MKSNKGIWIIVVMVSILVFGGLFVMFQGGSKASIGTSGKDTQETIEKRKEQKVDKSVFAATMEQIIEFEDGKSEGTLNIENLPENNYEIEVEIINEKKEVLYKSERIEPGMIIRKDKLEVALKKGRYLCSATFKAYDENEKEVSRVSTQIEIQIKK